MTSAWGRCATPRHKFNPPTKKKIPDISLRDVAGDVASMSVNSVYNSHRATWCDHGLPPFPFRERYYRRAASSYTLWMNGDRRPDPARRSRSSCFSALKPETKPRHDGASQEQGNGDAIDSSVVA